jgi:polysaccharide biosynthesis protein VpsQ
LNLNKNEKKISIITGTIFGIFFLYIIISANKGTLPDFISNLYNFPYGDKLGHIILMGLLSFFLNQILYPKSFIFLEKSIFTGSLLVLAIITAEEFSQIFISNRSFDLLDLFCSYAGIFIGDFTVKYYHKFK